MNSVYYSLPRLGSPLLVRHWWVRPPPAAGPPSAAHMSGTGAPVIPALGSQRQADLCEFETSGVYRVSSRTARTVTQRDPVSNEKNHKTKSRHHLKSPGKGSHNCAEHSCQLLFLCTWQPRQCFCRKEYGSHGTKGRM